MRKLPDLDMFWLSYDVLRFAFAIALLHLSRLLGSYLPNLQ